MKTLQMDGAANIFMNACDTDFFEAVNEIANLHSFGLSKPKNTANAGISKGKKRKTNGNLDVNLANNGNVWYWSCKYPNYRQMQGD